MVNKYVNTNHYIRLQYITAYAMLLYIASQLTYTCQRNITDICTLSLDDWTIPS